MEILHNLMKTIDILSPYILCFLAVVVVMLFIILLVVLKDLNKLEKRYKKLTRGVDGKNLEELFLDKVERIEANEELVKETMQQCEKLQKDIQLCIQKFSIIRYKAFEDVGSDLSFSIALLDSNNDGILITSIYGRHESVTYAKPVDRGISRYELSDEEITVLKLAMDK